jgi:hypothetical protein
LPAAQLNSTATESLLYRPGKNVVLSSSRMPGRMNAMRRDL